MRDEAADRVFERSEARIISCSAQPSRIGSMRLRPATEPSGFKTSQSPIQKSNWRARASLQPLVAPCSAGAFPIPVLPSGFTPQPRARGAASSEAVT